MACYKGFSDLADSAAAFMGPEPDTHREFRLVTYIALLRAVNVGGTGKLPMTDLKAMCEDAGFIDVRTYIASGNVVFRSNASAAKVKAALERRLADYAGKPVGVAVRTADELAAVLKKNPFPKAPQNRVVAIFLDAPPPKDVLKQVAGQNRDEMRLGTREIFVHYPDGIGVSKLRIPAAKSGTARNMNTVAKLVEIAEFL
jgi:uncharacterized protein (DUF1697 family)